MHEHVAPVSNRAVIGSALRIFTAKLDNFNLYILIWIQYDFATVI